MDLHVLLIIVTVFFASLGFLLFINRHIQSGKTFEEALAEKRQLAERLYGTNKKKKNITKKPNKKGKNAHESKKQKQVHSAVESDTKSDSGDDDGNASNASSNEQSSKSHVEFTEADFIAPETNTIEFKRQLSTGKMPARKTSTSKSPGSGILLNKSTSTPKPAPPTNGSIETLNNFDKIQPKDDLEIKKHRDESIGRTANHSKKDHKSGGKHNKKDNSPAQAEKVTNNQSSDAVDAQIITTVEIIASSVVAAPSKESPKNTPKEKPNKKKRNDALLIQQLVDAGVASSTSEAVNVNAIMQQLGRTELSRSEIQILIDFLLNKQQDTGSVTHADWSDDPVHKLRKQIEEKDRLLTEEQATTLAIQNKLRELRAEYNAERQQSLHRNNARIEEINTLKSDLHQAQQDHQSFVERTTNEKQALNVQLQHLQQKLFQEQNAQTQIQENTQKLQQLTDANAQFSAELLSKNNIIQDMQDKFLQIRDEHLKKMSDYEQKFQEYVRQSESDSAHLNSEIQRLRTECQRKEEIEKMFAVKKFELEQLESRLAEQSKQSNQIEDSSKVEIRNLQNALDSTKTELQLSRNELADSANRIGELSSQLGDLKTAYDAESSNVMQNYSKQIDELNESIQSYRTTISEKDAKLSELEAKLESASTNQREQELFKQIADYKDKNNELRKKNWKLVDALQKAEESAFKISSKCKLVAGVSPSKLSTSTISTSTTNDTSSDEQHEQYVTRTKEVFERLFPAISSNVDYDSWLTNLSSQIEQLQQQQQQQQNHQTNKKPTNQQNGDDDSDSDENVTGNGTHSHHHGQDNGIKISPSTEELILQNAQLKSTVDEYKTIVSDTEGVLNTLEKKVKEQDAYWRTIVQVKDNEIRSLKLAEQAVTST